MSKSTPSSISRRTVFAGAGVAGAVGVLAVASGLPGVEPAAKAVAHAQPQPSAGYQLTDHVKQYYATARI